MTLKRLRQGLKLGLPAPGCGLFYLAAVLFKFLISILAGLPLLNGNNKLWAYLTTAIGNFGTPACCFCTTQERLRWELYRLRWDLCHEKNSDAGRESTGKTNGLKASGKARM